MKEYKVIKPSLGFRNRSDKLQEILTTHEDFKKIPLVPYSELFPIYSLLGDTLILLKKPQEVLNLFNETK